MDKYELLIEKNKLDAWLRDVDNKVYYAISHATDKAHMDAQVIKNMQGIIDEIYYLVEKARMRQ